MKSLSYIPLILALLLFANITYSNQRSPAVLPNSEIPMDIGEIKHLPPDGKYYSIPSFHLMELYSQSIQQSPHSNPQSTQENIPFMLLIGLALLPVIVRLGLYWRYQDQTYARIKARYRSERREISDNVVPLYERRGIETVNKQEEKTRKAS